MHVWGYHNVSGGNVPVPWSEWVRGRAWAVGVLADGRVGLESASSERLEAKPFDE